MSASPAQQLGGLCSAAGVGVESLHTEEEEVGYTNPAAVRYQPQQHSKTALIGENVLLAAGLFASSTSRIWLQEDPVISVNIANDPGSVCFPHPHPGAFNDIHVIPDSKAEPVVSAQR